MEDRVQPQKTKVTLVVLTLVLVLAGAGTWYVRSSHIRNEVGKSATELLHESEATPYQTLTGESFTFGEYRGKIRVVNVWASWSPFAQSELPIISEVVSTYKERGVVALAINRNEPLERAQAYVATLPLLPELVYVIDETDAFYTSVGGYAMPETIIFNTAGDIVWHYRGVITKELLTEQLEELIL